MSEPRRIGDIFGERNIEIVGADPVTRHRFTQVPNFILTKINDADPQAWLADVFARIDDHAIHRLDELLPWNWAVEMERRKLAA